MLNIKAVNPHGSSPTMPVIQRAISMWFRPQKWHHKLCWQMWNGVGWFRVGVLTNITRQLFFRSTWAIMSCCQIDEKVNISYYCAIVFILVSIMWTLHGSLCVPINLGTPILYLTRNESKTFVLSLLLLCTCLDLIQDSSPSFICSLGAEWETVGVEKKLLAVRDRMWYVLTYSLTGAATYRELVIAQGLTPYKSKFDHSKYKHGHNYCFCEINFSSSYLSIS